MHRIISGILLSLFLITGLCLPAYAFAEDKLIIPLNDSSHNQFIINNDRVYISTPALEKLLGSDIKWIDRDNYKGLILSKNQTNLVFIMDNNYFLVKHGNFYSALEQMDIQPILINEQTYLPVKYVLEGLGYQLNYDLAHQQIEAHWTGTFIKEGYTIPVQNSLSQINFYPADLDIELIFETNSQNLEQQLNDINTILSSKLDNQLTTPILNSIKLDNSYINNSKFSIYPSNGQTYIRLWK
ncbi:stalk domain-containing protein [Desulforamulus aquiferis]|uniref:Stalk domain-containing protein n=1 Tax=Desulforamulus aquiferis TaxID=1397668 RepID=A0AAW7ZHH5_9FIRM|nr:stalk domain-containing protein [Desulforamulus aquiferis]MDO7788881.1 stalk domain-containing protein [Desulforamulus aquiferis]